MMKHLPYPEHVRSCQTALIPAWRFSRDLNQPLRCLISRETVVAVRSDIERSWSRWIESGLRQLVDAAAIRLTAVRLDAATGFDVFLSRDGVVD